MVAIRREDTLSHKKTLRDVIRHFTPAWFAVTMGTGSISILFHSFPYGTNLPVMRLFSLAFFFINLALFVLFTALSAARYILCRGVWNRMLRHPTQSLFLGTFPIGATTLYMVSISVLYGNYNFGGQTFVYFIWALWWLDVTVSMLCCWGILHIMITCQEHSFESVTLSWLLPAVPLVVGASTGATIAHALIAYSPNSALLTYTVSAFMVAVGLALSMMILTVYLIRTVTHGYSKGPGILSIFLPLGPTGQSAYAMLLIGSGLKSLLPLTYGDADGLLRTPSTGETIHVMCVVFAFAMWSFGGMWMIMAFLGMWHSVRRGGVSFRLTFWCMIFPNGAYANCTLALAKAFSSTILQIWGAIYAVATLLLWVYITVQTLRMCPGGRIFDALPMEEEIGAFPAEDKTCY